jgi:Kef-type K+ transport system membrane component KefB
MAQDPSSYLSLLVIALIAVIVPLIVKKIRRILIPIAVGEIVAGMIIGKSGLNLVGASIYLHCLFNLGFAFLMFMFGLESNPDLIIPLQTSGASGKRSQSMSLAVKYFTIALMLSFGMAFLLKYLGMAPDVILFAVIFSCGATGLSVPILKEKNMLGTEYGQTVLLISLLGNVSTMILLSTLVALQTPRSIYGIFLTAFFIPAFFLVYKMYNKAMKSPITEKAAHKISLIKTGAAFALLVSFLVLAQLLKAEMILGAFLAGLIVSLTNDREQSQLYEKLDTIGYGFFIPFCFIMIGVKLDIKDINPSGCIYLLPILLSTIYGVNFLSASILRFKYSWRQSFAAAGLLSARLSVILAAGAIGVQYGLISQEDNTMFILIAIVTCALSPYVFNRLSSSAAMSRA